MTKNKILINLAKISVVTLLLSICALDSSSTIPLFTSGVSLGYLALFTIANSRG